MKGWEQIKKNVKNEHITNKENETIYFGTLVNRRTKTNKITNKNK